MTIKQKAEAYDKALQMAKHALYCDKNGLVNTDKPLIMSLFPELKESEDAKEKELKKIENEPENYKQQVMSEMTDLVTDYIRQKPTWSREDEQNLNACIGYIPDEFLRRWLTDIIHVKYDKTAWSEEDKRMLLNVNCIIDGVWHSENTFGYSREELEEMWYWLNVAWHKLHYPIEDENWTENDEHWRQKAIDFIKHPDLIKATPTLAKDTIYWLKFLRPKNSYNPYKATVESIAKMCDKYEHCIQDEAEARDFIANVRVKCKDAAEYDEKYPQKQ